ncbi:MAG: hypothetical protein ACTSVW_00370 [Candidatus Njordarchaeales archaeon]
MVLDTIEEVDELIRKIEEYRNTLKWSLRDENTKGVWDPKSWHDTVVKAKTELASKKAELINFLKNIK